MALSALFAATAVLWPLIRKTKKASWTEYVLARELDDQYDVSGVVALPTGTTLTGTPCSKLTINGPQRGTMVVEVNGREYTIPEVLELFNPDENKVRSRIFPILYTNGGLHRPVRNVYSLITGLVQRTHKMPGAWGGGIEYDSEARQRRWIPLINSHLYLFQPVGDTLLLSLEEAAKCMAVPGKIKRALRAIDANNEGRTVFKKSMMIKYDETLKRGAYQDGEASLKPRIISLLDPTLCALTMNWARYMTTILHSIFDGKVLDLHTGPVRIFFASGSTAEDLDHIGHVLLTECACPVIVAAGDDSVFKENNYFYEGDQEQFDQSQDEAPLENSRAWMLALGCPEDVIDTLLTCYSMPYSADMDPDESTKVAIKGDPGWQMATGVTTTTVHSSVNTILMYLYLLQNRADNYVRSMEMVTESAKQLGFTLKGKRSETLYGVTFLRGWWVPDEHSEPIWNPLPSQVLKLGKILRSPKEIFRKLSDRDAVYAVARGLAACFKVDPAYPILGPFIASLRRLGDKVYSGRSASDVIDESYHNRIKRVSAAVVASRGHVLQMIEQRYGLTIDEVVEIEQLFDQVTSLPCFVSHPGILKLREVDYA